jgi:crossover junction endodeoxyribonuclease RuvC
MIVLGLDISSTTVGYGVVEIIDKNIKYIDCGFIKPQKDGTIVSRLNHLRNQVEIIFDIYQPDRIAIEDIISFMKGHSTATTIITLTTFNRMLCLYSYDYLGIEPQIYNVNTIRSKIKEQVRPKKEEIPEVLARKLHIEFPYEIVKKGRSKGKIQIESYDKADGLAVAVCYAMQIIKNIT